MRLLPYVADLLPINGTGSGLQPSGFQMFVADVADVFTKELSNRAFRQIRQTGERLYTPNGACVRSLIGIYGNIGNRNNESLQPQGLDPFQRSATDRRGGREV